MTGDPSMFSWLELPESTLRLRTRNSRTKADAEEALPSLLFARCRSSKRKSNKLKMREEKRFFFAISAVKIHFNEFFQPKEFRKGNSFNCNTGCSNKFWSVDFKWPQMTFNDL